MLRYIIFILTLIFTFTVNSNENLTIQQQLERLQREVSDLSKIIFSNDNNLTQSTQEDTITNFSAIDIRPDIDSVTPASCRHKGKGFAK